MKRFLIPCAALPLMIFGACDDEGNSSRETDAGVTVEAGFTPTPGVCELSRCPKPAKGNACCTPFAECGMDPAGMGLTCQPNPDVPSTRTCVLADCPTPLIGNACCTPLGVCGWDPLASGTGCFANPPPINIPDGGLPPLCDLPNCPTDGGYPPCCQLNGQCGVDLYGNGFCAPPPTCNLRDCAAPEFGPRSCCQVNGECGLDVLGIGICFPPPAPLCDLSRCPAPDGGLKPCCMLNGQCGVDALGIGLCFPPPPEPTCDLEACPRPAGGPNTCCMPNGMCGLDWLGIGLCFLPPPPVPDGGYPVVTEPPEDPSITGACPSYLGLFGPVWGCCSDFGICGTFAANECLLAVGTPLPVGPPPPPEAGVTEPFIRCTIP